MSDIVKAVEYIEKTYNMNVSRKKTFSRAKEIRKVEKKLGLKFSKEFNDFAKNFTYVDVYGDELGLLRDVLNNTERFREIVLYDEFPLNLYAIRYLEYNSSYILQDENGVVYYTNGYELPVKIFDSFEDCLYLDVVPELIFDQISDIYDDFYDVKFEVVKQKFIDDRKWFEEKYGLDFYFFVVSEDFKKYLSSKSKEDGEIRSFIEEYVGICGLESLKNTIPKADKSMYKKIERIEGYQYYVDYI